jgi:hypothetical protein
MGWGSDGPERDGSFASQKRVAELHVKLFAATRYERKTKTLQTSALVM